MKASTASFLAAALGMLAISYTSAEPDRAPDHLVQRDEVEAPTRSDNDDSCNVFQKQIRDPLGSDKLI